MRKNTATAFCIVILSTYYLLYGINYLERHFFFPLTYKNIVCESAMHNKINPAMIAAVILAESKYKSDASSEPGAKGLMQIMPETANWVQEQRKEKLLDNKALHDPKINIEVGTWYLKYLLTQYQNNEILALAAYNAGKGHVDEWMKEKKWDFTFNQIDSIPFPETREYVKKVLHYQKKYRELYNCN